MIMESEKRGVVSVSVCLIAAAFLLIAISCLMSGCVGINKLANMSPTERATWMMAIYNAEYELAQKQYETYVLDPDANPALLKVLKAKQTIFEKVYPLILCYVTAVRNGDEIDIHIEGLIIALLQELADPIINAVPEGSDKL